MILLAILGVAVCWLLGLLVLGGAARDYFPELFDPPRKKDEESEK